MGLDGIFVGLALADFVPIGRPIEAISAERIRPMPMPVVVAVAAVVAALAEPLLAVAAAKMELILAQVDLEGQDIPWRLLRRFQCVS